MNAEEDAKREAEEAKETVRQLIAKAGDGLDNPMLVAISEAAPSPTAADKHVTETLGWSNSVGRLARDMVRLRQKVSSETWKDLTCSQFRPSAVLFNFGEDLSPWNLQVETGMKWGKAVADRTSWPFLLREFRLPKTIFSVTTYDGDGNAPEEGVGELTYTSCYSFDFHGFCVGEPLGKSGITVVASAERPACFEIHMAVDSSDKPFVICGKSLTLMPKPGERIFPQFYKVLMIQRRFAEGNVYEGIFISARRDFFLCKGKIGTLIYRRVIGPRGNITVKLEVDYHMEPIREESGLILQVEKEKESLISVCFPEGGFAPTVSGMWPKETGKIVTELAEVLGNILYPRPLKEILCSEILENPPETLSDLLKKK